jgi:glycosyltransferase involved in cell wall biosynthesis
VAAAKILVDRGIDVEFVIVGDNAAPSRGLKARLSQFLGLQQNVKAEVMAEIERLGLSDRFHMLGFTARIAEAYELMDVLCFPSHFDAPGRPIFEAAFAGVPAIAALNQPMPDTLVHGVTGLAVPPRNARALAEAIATLALDRNTAESMGQAAKSMAKEKFAPKKNAGLLLETYRGVLARAK